MSIYDRRTPRQRLVYHVQELELLEDKKQDAADALKARFDHAQADGYDTGTLKVVLKLRKMTPEQRQERRALEVIYLAALGMLEGDPLTDEARRRLDSKAATPASRPGEPPQDSPAPGSAPGDEGAPHAPDADQPSLPQQPPLLPPKDPEEARKEGGAAAAAGQRVYDNPYRAGDPCRAAWDEGWCAQRQSNGMDTPAAFQRRTPTPDKGHQDDKAGSNASQQQGAA